MSANSKFSKEIQEEIIKGFYNQILFRQPAGHELDHWFEKFHLSSPGEIALEFVSSAERIAICKKIESNRIAFLHIPKTAGSAFNSIFSRITRKIHTTHSTNNPIGIHEANLVTGHFGYSGLASLDATHTFTILRDPIARIISLYRYGRSKVFGWPADDPVHHLDFEQWVSSREPKILAFIDNCYVRLMTDDLQEPFENRAAESLPLAIERYSQFTCVGDQSNLQPFLKKMSAALGIPCPPRFPRSNDSSANQLFDSGYEPKPQITDRARQRLKELTRLDYEVYNRFRDRENEMSVTIHNPTSRHWTSEGEDPIQVACHWLDETWNMVQFDAQRFPLPAEGIPPQETREVEIQVAPPKKPGRYHLMVTLVQTLDGKEKWLHETDEFTPQIFDREVEE